MKIAELRQLVKQYEQTSYQRQFAQGEHGEVIKIKQYLNTFENKLDDDELTPADLFELIKMIAPHSHLSLILSIKNHFRSNYFFEIFNTLNAAGLINENNFSIIYELSYNARSLLYNLFCNNTSIEHIELRKKVLETALALFNRLSHSNEEIKLLSERNIRRLEELIYGLAKANLLDQTSFEKALQRVTLKLLPVQESSVVKNSRKKTGLLRSDVTIDSTFCFFTEHNKKYEIGGCARVKKGHDAPDVDNPIYSIKELYESDLLESQQAAAREVKFHQLLGRKAFYFTKKGGASIAKTSIIANWQHEKSLYHFKINELIKVFFAVRLQCLISGLTDLNVLHAHYRVHGDIKPQNFILDVKNESMNLIDFGASRKNASGKNFVYTMSYLDNNKTGCAYSFCDDIYAMSIVIAHLFPELYSVTLSWYTADIKVIKNSSPTTAELAIVALVNIMINPNRESRCTSEEALHFCQALASHLTDLDELTLQKIMDATINRPDTTVEGVFRGVTRRHL